MCQGEMNGDGDGKTVIVAASQNLNWNSRRYYQGVYQYYLGGGFICLYFDRKIWGRWSSWLMLILFILYIFHLGWNQFFSKALDDEWF